jgi:hypothetical protein
MYVRDDFKEARDSKIQGMYVRDDFKEAREAGPP